MRSRSTTLLTSTRLRERPEPRWDKIRALRQAIARGDYETERRWAETLDRLLADLRS